MANEAHVRYCDGSTQTFKNVESVFKRANDGATVVRFADGRGDKVLFGGFALVFPNDEPEQTAIVEEDQ